MTKQAGLAEKNGSDELGQLIEPFPLFLERQGLTLTRDVTQTLQINLGPTCNQACKHCHLEAGSHRKEMMQRHTLEQVVSLAKRFNFSTIDITGGAPELHPYLVDIISDFAPLTDKLIIRSNLSAMEEIGPDQLIRILKANQVTVVGSFPSLDKNQAEAQRGKGFFNKSIRALERLNSYGYGNQESTLQLHLVSNPSGAFLSPDQTQTENRFRRELSRRWGVYFNRLFTFTNVPVGRFRSWLEKTGNLGPYLQRLQESFNPCALDRVMCRSLISIGWQGYVYDCDFNLALGLPMGGKLIHVSELRAPPPQGTPVATAEHCYTCTAGAGFT